MTKPQIGKKNGVKSIPNVLTLSKFFFFFQIAKYNLIENPTKKPQQFVFLFQRKIIYTEQWKQWKEQILISPKRFNDFHAYKYKCYGHLA